MAAPGPQPPSFPSAPPTLASPDSRTGAATQRGWQKIWQTRSAAAWALLPVSLLYGALVALRRLLYRTGTLKSEHPGRPVVVVGNVIAGGAGKTPVVIALVRHLQARGLHPGVISRGYGRAQHDCREVMPDSLPTDVGDEPALIARSLASTNSKANPKANSTGPAVPIFVAPHRTGAASALLAAHPHTDVIVCDDGLQHLALQRDIEVCVFNDQGIGNGFLLPAGPLREPWPRAVDLVLYGGSAPPPARASSPRQSAFALQRSLAPCALRSDGTRVPLVHLVGQPLHAIAAVARPGDFFAMLRAQGLTLDHTEGLPDHYDFNSWKGMPDKRNQLICTEKDAVKLWAFRPDALAVPLELAIDPRFFDALDALLRRHVPPAAQAPPLSSGA